ncbi:hypothetical protein HORIV_35010 [Vreelandella olivaria]|uniref:Uncharacterized protein n=1 Tax=Vreelandella olivaria TaxID=390919 RepID=A0ABN5X1N8_9GAMM|nr:hypothetical protein HORIV_35010 [Halomonas olivaria]
MKFWPTRKQWRYWSLPSRHTTAGLAVGVVGISLTVAFGILAIVFWLYPRVALDPASEAVLKSSNPTLLKLESAKLDTWLGDPEPYLTLVFKNVSEHAASDFSWDLVGEEGLMSFSPSQSAAPFQRDNLAVNPSSK